MLRSLFFGFCVSFLLTISIAGQQSSSESSASIVQPGAPGQPTQVLPSSTKAKLPPTSRKDVEFMQGMIMHHAQAVEMVLLMDSRTESKELRLLGARISHSQAEEMRFMERWLAVRGEPVSMPMANMSGGSHHHTGMDMSSHQMTMPGMLTTKQMDALKKSKGKEFDRLFLAGMIQHHEGALTMVKDLVEHPGTAQDSEVFNFITDVDSGQRAEIKIMQNMLDGKPQQEKR